MAKAVPLTFGADEGLKLELRWKSVARSGVDSATEGELRVLVKGEPVWFGETEHDPVSWHWSDLLEHLALYWLRLQHEEAFPNGLTPAFPSELRSRWLRQRSEIPLDRAREIESALYLFERAHDLARATKGLELPSLRIMREGNLMWLDWSEPSSPGDNAVQVMATECLHTLEAFGNAIAERLRSLSVARKDARGLHLIDLWDRRNNKTEAQIALLASGLDNMLFERVSEYLSTSADPSASPADRYSPVLLAAARMAGDAVTPEVLQDLLRRITVPSRRDRSELDRWSTEAIALLDSRRHDKFFEQGYALASWCRERALRVGNSVDQRGSMDPGALLKALGVSIEDIDLGDAGSGLDAVAVWSEAHGPHVFVNRSGRHAQGHHGRRTTIAHELCHMLVDRAGSLPFVEVLGGRTPEGPEKRARAFAAELLLPRAIAGRALDDTRPIEEIVADLSKRFEVGRRVVAWQILNAPDVDLRGHHGYLRKVAHEMEQ